MDPTRFDALARALSAQPTRRGVLRLLAGAALGGALGAGRVGRVAGACPAGTTDCGGVCRNLKTDEANCGACGRRCDRATPVYSKGHCCPQDRPTFCVTNPTTGAGACVNRQTNPNHCGTCGRACTTSVANARAVCRDGACGFACQAGFKRCGAGCIPTTACCTACVAPQTCGGGGTPGQCGCTPDCAGKCGGAGDGCGGTCDATCHVCSGKDAPNPCFPRSAPACGTSGTGRTCHCGTDIEGNLVCYDLGYCRNPVTEGACTSNADCVAKGFPPGSVCFSAENCCGSAPGVPATGCATPCPLPA